MCLGANVHVIQTFLFSAFSPFGGAMINGTNGQPAPPSFAAGLGSDESLGGALLTPIPWLRPERVLEGPVEVLSPGRAQAMSQLHGQLPLQLPA